MDCKEVIVTPNDDSTYKLEFIGVKFIHNGEELEGNFVFPKVSKDKVETATNTNSNANIYEFNLATIDTDDKPKIYEIIIPNNNVKDLF